MNRLFIVILIIMCGAGIADAGQKIQTGQPTALLTGSVTTYTSTQATGVGTAFDTELNVGDAIKINSEIFAISAIGSATALTLDSAAAGAGTYSAYCDNNLLTVYNGDNTAKFTLNKSGEPIISGTATPTSDDACTAGLIRWDVTYLYVCTATGAWKRLTLTTY